MSGPSAATIARRARRPLLARLDAEDDARQLAWDAAHMGFLAGRAFRYQEISDFEWSTGRFGEAHRMGILASVHRDALREYRSRWGLL